MKSLCYTSAVSAVFVTLGASLSLIDAFTIPSPQKHTSHAYDRSVPSPITKTSLFGYIRPETSESQPKNQAPYPNIGDLVRYYELDGGRQDGQELVGKITYIQKGGPKSQSWLAEVTELDNVGDGYYAEYPYRKRRKSRLYNLEEVSPLIGSFVRTEDAFKIPLDRSGKVSPAFKSYSLDGYEGPNAGPVDEQIVQSDLQKYGELKTRLLRDAAIAGLIGAIIADFAAGLNNALIYFAGAIAGVGYLFFLTVKTDTMGSEGAKLGSKVANLRFALPLIVLVGIALQNIIAGDASPVSETGNIFSSVSKQQFGAAMLGFLTYRIPLFVSQLAPVVGETAGMALPGSAGVAMQMAKDAKEAGNNSQKKNLFGDDLTTVFVVSGPAGTGKSELVQTLIDGSEGRLVGPALVDKIADPMMFEQLESRNEILQVDARGRYAMTKDGVINAARKPAEGEELEQVVVIDADVELSKKLANLAGTRLVGVWVGLDELEKFEQGLDEQIQSGKILIPDDETAETVRRSKIREIVKDIEYGVVSGIFEFTVLLDDFDESLLQLKNAAEYCFK